MVGLRRGEGKGRKLQHGQHRAIEAANEEAGRHTYAGPCPAEEQHYHQRPHLAVVHHWGLGKARRQMWPGRQEEGVGVAMGGVLLTGHT